MVGYYYELGTIIQNGHLALRHQLPDILDMLLELREQIDEICRELILLIRNLEERIVAVNFNLLGRNIVGYFPPFENPVNPNPANPDQDPGNPNQNIGDQGPGNPNQGPENPDQGPENQGPGNPN